MPTILSQFGTKKQIAVLIDPDKQDINHLTAIAHRLAQSAVDFVFVGGSLLTANRTKSCVSVLKQQVHCPVVLFPGNEIQIDSHADALLFLSLISGRNSEMLIGKHVVAAPLLRESGIEVIPTGYMLIDGGCATSVVYMSNTMPIPSNKSDIAVCTAIAGEMLGLRLIYMEAGSGAANHVSVEMISRVKSQIHIPLLVGGGIQTPEMAQRIAAAGADLIVVGTALERSPMLIDSICDAVHSL